MSTRKTLKSNTQLAAPAKPSLLQEALTLHRSGQLEQAESLYLDILNAQPQIFDALHLLGLVHTSNKRYDLAIALLEAALSINPRHADAYNNLGFTLHAAGRLDEAADSYRRALAIAPAHADAHNNLGNVFKDLSRTEEAIECYRAALRYSPGHADALNNLGSALKRLEQFDEAIDAYRKALEVQPNLVEAWYNLGNALHALRRFDEAIDCYQRALHIQPRYAEVYNNFGRVLQDLKRYDEAALLYRKAMEIKPDYAEACNNLGSVLQDLRKLEEAAACYQHALVLRPLYADPHSNLGNLLREAKKLDEAIACYRRALEIDPSHADAHYNLGNALKDQKKHDAAIASYRTVLDLMPQHRYAFGMLADSVMKICEWSDMPRLMQELSLRVQEGQSIVSPFTFFGLNQSPAEQLLCARQYVQDKISRLPPPLWSGQRYRHERIRVAYLSADFHQHATAYLIAELFELHDRTQFEVIGISFGPDDGSPMRTRLKTAFDRFVDVRFHSDAEVAKLINQLEVDIAVDLKGFTQDARLGILAHRPAPVQVNYLGYPGTMGADFIDYVIADRWVAPFEQQMHFSERIVHLPDSYQVNDRQRVIAAEVPTRAQYGLPEQGFVWCSFNNNYKILPAVFDIWMRLLHQVEGSVLWLLSDNDLAERNLRREAALRGVDPMRLIFAPRAPLDVHLARHRLADLFVDTLPVNAHTTASDALWAGLPLLTCAGTTFAGRVAASLLHAVGLPELVAADLADYERKALELATDPHQLQVLRTRLQANCRTSPLFDTDRFRRHLEAAYRTMWETAQRGEKPTGFMVQPIHNAG